MNQADTPKTPEPQGQKKTGKNATRREKAVDNMTKNVVVTGHPNTKNAMKDAGYSENYAAHHQHEFVKTKSFREQLDARMPAEKVLGWHENLGEAKKLQVMQVAEEISDTDIEVWVASINCVLYKIIHGKKVKHVMFWTRDNKAVKDAIDMAYKLRGDYAPEKIDDVSNPFRQLSDGELQEAINEMQAFLTKQSPTKPQVGDTTEGIDKKADVEDAKETIQKNVADNIKRNKKQT